MPSVASRITSSRLTSHLIIFTTIMVCYGNHDAKRLFDDLLRKGNYNKLVRPVSNHSEKLTVRLGLKFTQLIDVDEVNEVITTNMWVQHEWEDNSLKWNPVEYGGVTNIYVPADMLWIPDIVLYNNADGDYTVSIFTKATLTFHGLVIWTPPAIYKSQCDITVEYFPFDEQRCTLKFSVWTYDGFKVDLRHRWQEKHNRGELSRIDPGIDLTEFYPSVEWDLMEISAIKHIAYYPCCEEPYPDITFYLRLRRKTLFYCVNLIIPCVAIALLTCLTFYLPCDSGEKISLSISILLSLSLFQLLLMELVPPTSMNVPLLAKFILFTNIVVASSIGITVVVLAINFRSGSTHKMPKCVRKLLLKTLPRLLWMENPEEEDGSETGSESETAHSFEGFGDVTDTPRTNGLQARRLASQDSDTESQYSNIKVSPNFIGSKSLKDDFCKACVGKGIKLYPVHMQKALEGVSFIKKHLEDEDDGDSDAEDWKFASTVIDRMLLWIYVLVCTLGSAGLLLKAPALYDNNPACKGGQGPQCTYTIPPCTMGGEDMINGYGPCLQGCYGDGPNMISGLQPCQKECYGSGENMALGLDACMIDACTSNAQFCAEYKIKNGTEPDKVDIMTLITG